MSFQDVKRSAKQAEQNRKGMEGAMLPEIFLRGDGEEVEMWFYGSPEEPVMRRYHTLSDVGGRKFSAELCANGWPDHDGCVFCYRASDKRISAPKDFAVLNAYDTRFVHKQKDEARSKKAGRDRFDWSDCTGDGCRACKKGIPRARRARSKLRLGPTVSSALSAVNDRLGMKCLNCGGKTKIDGYRKGKKRIESLDDVEDPTGWELEVSCSKCTSPQPISIFNVPVTMKRSGIGKTTSYQFFPGDPGDLPKYVAKAEPVDLAAMPPRSAESMARLLGIPNPFAGGKGKSRDDEEVADEEEDEDEDPFDNSEDDEE